MKGLQLFDSREVLAKSCTSLLQTQYGLVILVLHTA